MLMTTKTRLPMLLKTFVASTQQKECCSITVIPVKYRNHLSVTMKKKYLQIVSKHMLKDVTALYNGWDKGLEISTYLLLTGMR